MLVPQTLATQLLDIFTRMRQATEISDQQLANELANAIDTYIKTAQVNPGIPVSTTGTPTAQTGATTGPGSLS